MEAKANWIKDTIDFKIFAIGIFLSVLFYAGLFTMSVFNAETTIKDLENQLASQSVSIQPLKPLPNQTAEVEENGQNDIGQAAEHATDISKEQMSDQTTEPSYTKLIAELTTRRLGFNIPVIRKEDGLTSFAAYRKAMPANTGGNQVAIVLTDIGASDTFFEQLSQSSVKPLTISLSPYGNTLQDKRDALKKAGHEVWLNLPIENQKFPADDPGSQALRSRTTYDYNRNKLYWTLSQLKGYAGITAFTDNAFAESRTLLKAIFNEVFERGLGFFEENENAPAMINMIAANNDAPYIKTSINLDNQGGLQTLTDSLALLQTMARNNSFAVLTMEASPKSLETLATWKNGLSNADITLVPLSTLMIPKEPETDSPTADTEQSEAEPMNKDE